MQRERNHQACKNEEALKIIKARHVLFIEGFGNELTSATERVYPRSCPTAMGNTLGASLSFITPPSMTAAHKNVDSLLANVQKTHAEVKKPLILFGHSKGGLEALYLVLKYPFLILDGIVDRAILLQSPIRGSLLCGHIRKKFPNSLLHYFVGDGVKCLTPQSVSCALRRAYRKFEEFLRLHFGHLGPDVIELKRQEVSNRIFYARTFKHSEKLNQLIRVFLFAMGKNLNYLGQNDGILLLDEQKTDLIGTDLGIVEADHLDIIATHSTFEKKRESAIEFVRTLLHSVYMHQSHLKDGQIG